MCMEVLMFVFNSIGKGAHVFFFEAGWTFNISLIAKKKKGTGFTFSHSNHAEILVFASKQHETDCYLFWQKV